MRKPYSEENNIKEPGENRLLHLGIRFPQTVRIFRNVLPVSWTDSHFHVFCGAE